MCWADYSDVQNSTKALRSIRDQIFTPSPGKEIRIEYARNPMGTPKKMNHSQATTA